MNCDVVMQMLCANCHLHLGLGFLLGHFFGCQCCELQGVCLLVMPGGAKAACGMDEAAVLWEKGETWPVGAHLSPKFRVVARSMSSNTPCTALQTKFPDCAQCL